MEKEVVRKSKTKNYTEVAKNIDEVVNKLQDKELEHPSEPLGGEKSVNIDELEQELDKYTKRRKTKK